MEDPPTSSVAISLSDPADDQDNSSLEIGQQFESKLQNKDLEVSVGGLTKDDAPSSSRITSRKRLSTSDQSLLHPGMKKVRTKPARANKAFGCSRCRFSANGCTRCRVTAKSTPSPIHHVLAPEKAAGPSRFNDNTSKVQKFGCSKCRYSRNGCGKCRRAATQPSMSDTTSIPPVPESAPPPPPPQRQRHHASEPATEQKNQQESQRYQHKIDALEALQVQVFGCSKCRWATKGCGKCRTYIYNTPVPMNPVESEDEELIQSEEYEKKKKVAEGNDDANMHDHITAARNTIKRESADGVGNTNDTAITAATSPIPGVAIPIDGFCVPPTQPIDDNDDDEEMDVHGAVNRKMVDAVVADSIEAPRVTVIASGTTMSPPPLPAATGGAAGSRDGGSRERHYRQGEEPAVKKEQKPAVETAAHSVQTKTMQSLPCVSINHDITFRTDVQDDLLIAKTASAGAKQQQQHQQKFGCSKCRWAAKGCGKCRDGATAPSVAVGPVIKKGKKLAKKPSFLDKIERLLEEQQEEEEDEEKEEEQQEEEIQEQQEEQKPAVVAMADAAASAPKADTNIIIKGRKTFGCSKCRWSAKGCGKCRTDSVALSSHPPPSSSSPLAGAPLPQKVSAAPKETPIPESFAQLTSTAGPSFTTAAAQQHQQRQCDAVPKKRSQAVAAAATTTPVVTVFGCSKCRWAVKGCGRCRSEEYRAKLHAMVKKDQQPMTPVDDDDDDNTHADGSGAITGGFAATGTAASASTSSIPPPPTALDLIREQQERLQKSMESSKDDTWWDPLDPKKVAMAKTALHVSAAAVPGNLPLCREREADAVDRWLADRLQSAQGGALYLSGVPGTGKSLTALELVRQCGRHATVPTSRCPLPPALLSINCMRLTEPRQVVERILAGYRTACRRSLQNIPDARYAGVASVSAPSPVGGGMALAAATTAAVDTTTTTTATNANGFGTAINTLPQAEDPIIYVPDDEDYIVRRVGALDATDACEALHQIVLQQLPGPEAFWKVHAHNDKKKRTANAVSAASYGRGMIVVILDELDGLLGGRHGDELVGELFALAALPRSRLVLISIANSIDLVQQLMRPGGIFHRHNLRPAHEIFPSYLRDQIASLLSQRLANLPGPVFNDNVLGLCARKIANGNGDMRRALEVASRAIDILVEEEQERNAAASIADGFLAASPSGRRDSHGNQPRNKNGENVAVNLDMSRVTSPPALLKEEEKEEKEKVKQKVRMSDMARALSKLTGGVGVSNDTVSAIKKLPVPQQLLMVAVGKLLGETLADRGGSMDVVVPQKNGARASNAAARFIGHTGGVSLPQLSSYTTTGATTTAAATTITGGPGARKSKELTLGELQEAHAHLCKRVGVTAYSASEFSTAVDMLVSHGLIEIGGSGKNSAGGGGGGGGGGGNGGNGELKRRKISLRVPEDDVLMAMADVPVLKSILGQ